MPIEQVQIETTGTRKTCATIEADLRGLAPGYGMTRLVIDERCRERGLVPAQVRKLTERYFAQNGISLQQLDVIVLQPNLLLEFAVHRNFRRLVAFDAALRELPR